MNQRKNLFVVGDLHGCYYTFRRLLEFWQPEEAMLVQVGDIIDRGNFSPETVELCRSLQAHKGAIFLMGNHDNHLVKHLYGQSGERWYAMEGASMLQQYERKGKNWAYDALWMEKNPLYWANESLFISHAGVSPDSANPFDINDRRNIFRARGKLKNIGKTQVVGHTPQKEGVPRYDAVSGVWYVDTGAVFGIALSALLFTPEGEKIAAFSVPTDPRDIAW